MIQSAIATAADYADAMITARRAKNLLFVIILLMLALSTAKSNRYRLRGLLVNLGWTFAPKPERVPGD